MQRAYGRGYARSIGVSNFGVSDLDAVLEVADVPPVINQVQFSPFAFRRALLEACDRRGVALEPYSPLGTGRHLGDRRVAGIAERLGRTRAQVLIRWSLQRDLVVLPKSTHDGDALIFGSQTRWTDLLAHGLVDELRLMIGPKIVAGDHRAFDGVAETDLRLIGVRAWAGRTTWCSATGWSGRRVGRVSSKKWSKVATTHVERVCELVSPTWSVPARPRASLAR
jgi:Aldo/keto reductase family/RibD C-terminal domain